jgi:hypothetical protein
MSLKVFTLLTMLLLAVSTGNGLLHAETVTGTERTYRVRGISFEGLKWTKEKALVKELFSDTTERTVLEIGSAWNSMVKEEARQSLLNMGLFDTIKIDETFNDDGSVEVTFELKEKVPMLILPFGDFTTTRGFRVKTLFRWYNVAGFRKQFWVEAEFTQLSTLNLILRYIDPAIGYNDRWSSDLNVNIFSSVINYHVVGDPNLQTIFKREAEEIRWNEDLNAGFAFNGSVSYRIPKLEASVTPKFDINYTNLIVDGDFSGSERTIYDINSLSVAVGAGFGKSWVKEGELTPTGNKFDMSVMFYLPTTLGENNERFRFSFTFTDTFYYTFKRNHHLKFRARFFANYNRAPDYSSELRGTAAHEFEGWIGAFINLDYYLPLFSVDFSRIMNFDPGRELMFQVFWSFFVDMGATLVNMDNEDVKPEYIINNDGGFNVLKILPALTAGTGVRIYPRFISLIIRLDVGVNGWKFIREGFNFSALPRSLELYITFSKFF